MATLAITTVSEARAVANEWLMSHLPDRFTSGIPDYDQTLSGWRIPVWLSYPQLAPLGPVGELLVEAVSGNVKPHTSLDEMKDRALKLYEHHREQIEAPLLQTRNPLFLCPSLFANGIDTFGIQLDESELRDLTDCSPLGTDAFQLIEAARHLGLPTSRKQTLESLEELAALIEEGAFPIVYIDMWPLRGGLSGQNHALVVVAVDLENVSVLDPLAGERTIAREDFQVAWAEMRFLTIVIRR